MKKYTIEELAGIYGLTNDQLMEYILLNNIKLEEFNKNKIDQLMKKFNKNTNSHTNKTSLKYIEIKKLFGKEDYFINFKDDIIILVSENGKGKTTILNIIVSLLSGDVKTLLDIHFEEINIKLNHRNFTINKKNIPTDIPIEKIIRLKEHILFYIERYLSKLELIQLKQVTNFEEILNSLNKVVIKISHLLTSRELRRIKEYLEEIKEIQYSEILRTLLEIKSLLKEEIVFYPTYRRIELGFDKLFLYNDRNYQQEFFSKNMGFGMEDVKLRINNLLQKMKEDAGKAYLEMNAQIINELLENKININRKLIDFHKVEVAIKRVGEEKIKNIDELKLKLYANKNENTNMQFLIYYLHKLINIYDNQKAIDEKLSKFSEVCSKYLYGKKLTYDEANLTMNIYDNFKNEIDFNDLSSGEKQVIAIFSKVYLDVTTPCIFIIDEPELSLSIDWQKEILSDIYASEKVGLMLVTTHSPFIFKNDYRNFTYELETYLEEI